MRLVEGSHDDYIGFITIKSLVQTSLIAYSVSRSGKVKSLDPSLSVVFSNGYEIYPFQGFLKPGQEIRIVV